MSAPHRPLRVPRRSQRGVTLIIVMVILVIVTILGIGGAQLALSGERTTRYDRDALIASQAAEAALMDAQNDISSPSSARAVQFYTGNSSFFGTGGCSAGAVNNAASARGLCQPTDSNSKPNWLTVDFSITGASAQSAAIGDFTGIAFQAGTVGVVPALVPRYIIEDVLDQSPGTAVSMSGASPRIYRITAIGYGPNQQVQVVMQTAYRKP